MQKGNGIRTLMAAIVATAALPSVVLAESAYHVNGDNDYASLYSYSPSGRIYLTLNQVKSTSNNTNGTYTKTQLYYNVYQYGVGYYAWSGVIDDTDVAGDGNGNITLNTDTCNYIASYACGQINVTWKKDVDYSTKTSGVTRQETPSFIKLETGTKTSYRSTVTGSVKGVSLDGVYGSASQGSYKSTNLTISNK